MRLTKTLIASALALLAAQSQAAPTLTFEVTEPDASQVDNFYSGFLFSGTGWFVNSQAAGGFGDFNAPDPDLPGIGIGALLIAKNPLEPSTGQSQILEIAVDGGFESALDFWWTGGRASFTVTLYKNNEFIKSFEGFGPQTTCDAGISCKWAHSDALTFEGTANRVVFTAAGDATTLLDNITFGSRDPGGNVPEPASLGLTLAALSALALTRRRKG
jgi:hypothetical protein